MKQLSFAFIALTLAWSAGCKKDEGQQKGESAPKTTDQPEAPEGSDSPDEGKEAEAPDPELVERGAYLAAVAGCAACHTPIGPKGPVREKAFAGGLEVKEAFGTWRSPNITPDEKTGIGAWSDEEIIASIRRGVRPSGEQLYPIMPYMYYNALSDRDARALVAFLRSLDPVENAVEGNTNLKLPQPKAPEPDSEPPPEGDEVAQGEYIADLMHCAYCHTPMTESGKPDMEKLFAGGFEFELYPPLGEGTVYTPNITPAKKTGIGTWSDEEIIAAVRRMQRPGDKPMIGPPMLFYIGTWPELKDEDAENLVKFLRSLEPIENEVKESTFEPSEMLAGMMKKMQGGGTNKGGAPKRGGGEKEGGSR